MSPHSHRDTEVWQFDMLPDLCVSVAVW